MDQFIREVMAFFERMGTPIQTAPRHYLHKDRTGKPTSDHFLLTFMHAEDSLLFYLRFKDYHWSNHHQAIVVKMGNDGWNEKVRSREFTPFMLRTNKCSARLWADIKTAILPALAT